MTYQQLDAPKTTANCISGAQQNMKPRNFIFSFYCNRSIYYTIYPLYIYIYTIHIIDIRYIFYLTHHFGSGSHRDWEYVMPVWTDIKVPTFNEHLGVSHIFVVRKVASNKLGYCSRLQAILLN